MTGAGCSVLRIIRRLTLEPDFHGDICLVTGAGRGLGRELALKFADYGATMVLWDITEEGIKALAEKIREKETDVYYYVCDCSNKDEVQATADRVRKDVGNVTILINNAGVAGGKTLLDSSEEDIQRVMEVDALAHFWVSLPSPPPPLQTSCGDCSFGTCSKLSVRSSHNKLSLNLFVTVLN